MSYSGYPNLSAAAAMMGMANNQQAAAFAALAGRNPYQTGSATGYPTAQNMYNAAGLYNMAQAAPAPAPAVPQAARTGNVIPQNPDIRFVKLPFYDIHGEILKPTSLMPHGNTRFQVN